MDDMEFKEISLASTNKAEGLEIQIETILDALGHPEALVTDESEIYHFLDIFYDEDERQAELDKIERLLGIEVEEDDFIIDVAERLKFKNV